MHDIIILDQHLGEDGEAEIAEWYVEDGDTVQSGQAILELETAKTTTEVEASDGGKIEIVAQEGDVVVAGDVVGRVS